MSKMEKDQEELKAAQDVSKMYAALGFAVVMIVIGVPVWWKTTAVYRVSLPYTRIQDMDDLSFRQQVPVTLIMADHGKGQELKTGLQFFQNNSVVFEYSVSCRARSVEENAAFRSSPSLDVLDAKLSILQSTVAVGSLYLVEITEDRLLEGRKVVLGRHRTIYFTSVTRVSLLSEILSSVILGEPSIHRMMKSVINPAMKLQDKPTMRRVQVTTDYDILLNLINPEPGIFSVQWDIEKAMQNYVQPFINKLMDVANFSVKSQVLYLTTLNIQPDWNESQKEFCLLEQQLSLVINPVESKLASHVSSNPALNFLIYVPRRNNSPLKIYDSNQKLVTSNAFLSPRWGGILIYNVPTPPDEAELPVLVKVDMKKVMGIILTQLRLLIGILGEKTSSEIIYLHPDGSSLRDWEHDYLMRLRAMENLLSSRTTLQSLAQLLEEISNIVINDEVGSQVYQAVEAVFKATLLLNAGHLEEGFRVSREAFIASEQAFFDPSMLALLYFPDDQKYAIYIPLFLPIGIPVVMSLKNIRRWFKMLRGEKAKTV